MDVILPESNPAARWSQSPQPCRAWGTRATPCYTGLRHFAHLRADNRICTMNDVTRILSAIEQGDPAAAEQLLPLVYDELRKLAAQKMAREKPGQTLDATALVHEAFVRLVGSDAQPSYRDRRHFFATAATAMRRILIDNARRKRAEKHGGRLERVPLDNLAASAPDDEILALNEAPRN